LRERQIAPEIPATYPARVIIAPFVIAYSASNLALATKPVESFMAVKKKAVDFEQSLNSLEALVNKMESGELSLEESLKAFETGIQLTRECQARLAAAEQQVQKLVEQQGGELSLEPFDARSDDE